MGELPSASCRETGRNVLNTPECPAPNKACPWGQPVSQGPPARLGWCQKGPPPSSGPSRHPVTYGGRKDRETQVGPRYRGPRSPVTGRRPFLPPRIATSQGASDAAPVTPYGTPAIKSSDGANQKAKQPDVKRVSRTRQDRDAGHSDRNLKELRALTGREHGTRCPVGNMSRELEAPRKNQKEMTDI